MEALTAAWLASRREELNQRFVRALRRWPGLDAHSVLTTLGGVLPPLAGPEPGTSELLSAVYDLVLLHEGRGTRTRPGIATLLQTTLPALRPILLQRPGVFPAALSNAVESLGDRGQAFAAAMATLPLVTADTLLDAGALVAWRLGQAPLRESAIAAGRKLPAALVAAALQVADGPAALRALAVDAWRLPGTRPAGTSLVGSAGDFSGFGGHFDTPPLVLDGGDRHVIFARTGEGDWRIDADLFGWTCRPEPPSDRPVRVPAKRGVLALLKADTDRVEPDGTVVIAGAATRFPAIGGATAFSIAHGRVAVSLPDSHRIRIGTLHPA